LVYRPAADPQKNPWCIVKLITGNNLDTRRLTSAAILWMPLPPSRTDCRMTPSLPHGGLYGVGPESVQGFPAGLSDVGWLAVYLALEAPPCGIGSPVGGPE
jgi:hypothetical protein